MNQQARSYNNQDVRRISQADAIGREKNNEGGWQNEKKTASRAAQANKAAEDNGRQNTEFDSFAQRLNQRNQKLWDTARRDVVGRESGRERERALDGSFQFTPDNNADRLGLGRSGAGTQAFGGRATFGGAAADGRGDFMGALGSSKFGQTSGIRSNFGGVGGSQYGGAQYGGAGSVSQNQNQGGSYQGGSQFGNGAW